MQAGSKVKCAAPMRRPEVFGGRRFLLKSIHYDATHRADLFTLPCSAKVSHSRAPACPRRIHSE